MTCRVVYLITSSTGHHAPPAALAGWIQGHLATWNRPQWTHNVTYDEDHSTVRTATTPRIMAALHNTATSIGRLEGWTNIAAALRHHARNPGKAITCLLNRPGVSGELLVC